MKGAATSNELRQTNRSTALVPVPDPGRPFAGQPPEVLFAMCLFGEARGESAPARRAVAQVILNRIRFPRSVFGSRRDAGFFENLRGVILKPRQFSCFLANDPNYPKLLRPLDFESVEVWERCLTTARQAIAARDARDAFTRNSDHYFDISIQPPAWADPLQQTVQLGRLRFYRLYLPWSGAEAGARTSFRSGNAPENSRRVPPARLRITEAEPVAAHRRERSGSTPPLSCPAPHLPSQRKPRLGPNRWAQSSRALSTLT
jgi:hypothetical protein